MKDRLLGFMQSENISAGKLAEIIGVQPSAISHITSGRNKPGFDFLASLFSNFPDLNPKWMITGEGEMDLKTPRPQNNEVVSQPETSAETVDRPHDLFHEQVTVVHNTNDPAITEGPKHVDNKIVFEKEAAPIQNNVRESNSGHIVNTSPGHIVNISSSVERIVIFYTDGTFSMYEDRSNR